MSLRSLPCAAAVALALVGATGCGAGDAASGAAGVTVSATHPSGLVMFARGAESDLAEEVKGAVAVLDLIAESNPDDLGFASVAADGTTVVISTVTPAGAAAVEAALRGEAPTVPPGATEEQAKIAGSAAAGLPRLVGVDVVQRPTTISRAQTLSVADRAVELAAEPDLQDAGIFQTRPDPATGAVIVTMGRLTEVAAQRLVRDFGVDAVLVEIDPDPQLATPAKD